MPTLVPTAPGKNIELWNAEEFLDWLEPGVRAELLNGKLLMHSPVSTRHARLVNFLDRLVAAYVEQKQLGEIHRETFTVRLDPRRCLMPDIAFFTNAQLVRFEAAYSPLAPPWVAEVLSPGTAENDTVEKFAAYEQHGVQEYWILDPEALAHRFYARRGELLVEFSQGEAIIVSRSIPGFWVRRSWLNPEGMPARPSVASALAELFEGRSS
jgi:Uma2 family endonuclease